MFLLGILTAGAQTVVAIPSKFRPIEPDGHRPAAAVFTMDRVGFTPGADDRAPPLPRHFGAASNFSDKVWLGDHPSKAMGRLAWVDCFGWSFQRSWLSQVLAWATY